MTLLQDTVRKRSETNPDAIALVYKQDRATYGELEESGNKLARALRTAGCIKGDRVGLLLPKSIPAIVGMLGTLKAGCVYVPLDSASPAARLSKIVDSSDPRCILAVGSTEKL